MATEEAVYTIVQEDAEQNIQIRAYAPAMIAKVTSESGQNNSFMQLFRYIDGNNIAQQNIAMTTPVTQQSQKIAMTTPVTQQGVQEGRTMVFYLPKNFTPENTPQPTNPNVQIEQLPGKKIATIQFSGRMTNSSIEEHKEKLETWLNTNNISYKHPHLTAAYNAPFTPWFLRRNEIWFEMVE